MDQCGVLAAGAAGVGALLWSKRNQIGDAFDSGMDRLSEMKSQRMDGQRPQSQISEEAMTLKETGRKTKAPQQDYQPGVATSNQEAKAGAKAYS